MPTLTPHHRNHHALKALAKTIRAIRESQGLSQEQLADLAGLHRTYIGHVERAESNLTVVTLVKIAEALGLGTEALVVQAHIPDHCNTADSPAAK